MTDGRLVAGLDLSPQTPLYREDNCGALDAHCDNKDYGGEPMRKRRTSANIEKTGGNSAHKMFITLVFAQLLIYNSRVIQTNTVRTSFTIINY